METQVSAAPVEPVIPAWGSFGADSSVDNPDVVDTPVVATDEPADVAATPAVDEKPADVPADDASAADNQVVVPEQAPAPLLVATAPADADTKLAEISTQKLDLADKFEDGELTSREYMEQLDALNKQERKIESEIQKAQLAEEMAAQQAQNAFLAEVANFTANTPYVQSKAAWDMLDAEVRKVASAPANAGLTGRQVLEKAHAGVLKDPIMALAFGNQQQAAKPSKSAPTPVQAKKPEVPVTLAHVPAAERSDVGEGRFAVIDRIEDPEARAQAVAKMTQADRDAYLTGA